MHVCYFKIEDKFIELILNTPDKQLYTYVNK